MSNRALEKIKEKMFSLENKIKQTSIIVILLGAGGKGLKERREIKKTLKSKGIIALVPEDDFPSEAPSLTEEAILEDSDIDLIFINVESWGSVAEFVQFSKNSRIAPKLRVLVNYQYHPLYGTKKGYLSDLYLTFMAIFGHVYAYDEKMFPTPKEIITILADRFRAVKLFKKF